MTSPSPRPIREQVSRPSHDESRIRDALDRGEGLTRHEGHELVDQIDRLRQAVAGSGEEAELAAQAAQHLDAEVRALRAELDDAHSQLRGAYLTQEHVVGEIRRAAEQALGRDTTGQVWPEVLAALAARTPQPAEQPQRDELAQAVARRWRDLDVGVRAATDHDLADLLDLLADAYRRAALALLPSGPAIDPDRPSSEVLEQLRELARRQDGEDVPARLEAAADACEALGWTGTANTFRDLASQLREWDEEAPEVRAAVAAALARPAGHQQ